MGTKIVSTGSYVPKNKFPMKCWKVLWKQMTNGLRHELGFIIGI